MKVTPLSIPDVLLLESTVYEDERGTSQVLFHQARSEELGLPTRFVQDNLSCSKKSVIRGLHYQRALPQGKLISVIHGRVFDVAVDLRVGSSTFGSHTATELEAGDGRSVYVPPGFAHGFAALSEGAAVLYKCQALYDPEDQFGIAYDDPDLAIPWPVGAPRTHPRDTRWPRLRDAQSALFRGLDVP